MQVFWIVFSHFPYIFCAHCILYSKNLYFFQCIPNYLFVFYIITFSIFPGASLNSQGLGKAADLRFLHTVENVTAAIRNSYREKQGEEIRMRPRPLRPVFFRYLLYTKFFELCDIFNFFKILYTAMNSF